MANIILSLYYIPSEFFRICMGQMEPFLVFMPFCYSASWPCLVSRRVLLSSRRVSLFFLTVLTFLRSRHCCRIFDVYRGDGSESSPVSFHVSLNVDFEPVSVKLRLITTGSTWSTQHTHRRRKLHISQRRVCCCMLKSYCFSWWKRHFDGSPLFGVYFFLHHSGSVEKSVFFYSTPES